MEFEVWWGAGLGGVLGLLIGSFLNVVIYRLDARASLGVAGGSNYVERSVSASMEM